MEEKKFTITDLRNSFIAGENFNADFLAVELGEKDEVTTPDFGDWVKKEFDIEL
jgi:hypothetical protein